MQFHSYTCSECYQMFTYRCSTNQFKVQHKLSTTTQLLTISWFYEVVVTIPEYVPRYGQIQSTSVA